VTGAPVTSAAVALRTALLVTAHWSHRFYSRSMG